MTAVRRTLAVVLIVLASVLVACTPAGAPQPPADSSTPGGNPVPPSLAPGAYGY